MRDQRIAQQEMGEDKAALREIERFEPIYTGGKIVWAKSGEFFVCACTEEVYVVEFITGHVKLKLEGVYISLPLSLSFSLSLLFSLSPSLALSFSPFFLLS